LIILLPENEIVGAPPAWCLVKDRTNIGVTTNKILPTMMKTCLLFLTLPFATAFSPKRGYKVSTHLASVLEDSKLEPIDFDLERAKQCAENFGSCSVEEMEMLRDSKFFKRFRD
jgi:hypothetical protein